MGFFHPTRACGVGAVKLWITAVVFSAAVIPSVAGGVVESLERLQIPRLGGSSLSAYPSVERLEDGRLLCVFSARYEQQAGKLVLAGTISEDHGRTWSKPSILLNSTDGDDYDPSIIAIGPRVIVSATTTPLNETAIATSRIIAVRSEDSGRSWSQPYEIPTGRRYTSGKVNNGIVLRDGTALLGYTWEKNLDDGRIQSLASEGEMEEVNAVLLSGDDGRTWTSSKSVGLPTRKADSSVNAINGLCEPALAECEDGSVFMLSRTGLTNLYGARSVDGGRSWSKPHQTSLVSHNAPAAMCAFHGVKSGILAVWNNSPEHRWPLCVAASFDGCRTWSAPQVIAHEKGLQSSYPGCVQTADGKILVVYQQDGEKGRDILGVRFEPAWLAGAGGANGASVRREQLQLSNTSKGIAPRKLAHFTSMPKPAMLPDGTMAVYFIDHEGPGLAATPEQQTVYARYSKDEGVTWSSPESLLELPAEAGGFGYFVVLVDRTGEVHLFILCDANTGAIRPRPADSGKPRVEPLARQRLDIWHVNSVKGRTGWSTLRQIWQGRAGDLQSVTQLASGRIVLPISYYVDRNWANRGDGLAQFTYTGQFDTTVLYSDDAGVSWHLSPSVLRTVTPDLSSYGAVEPVVLELADGRVWMLLRTQLGRFYESFSSDGAEWSGARPSNIMSSDSPAALARLPDGRILMLWNNCQRHPYAQGSRHVLHAAVSADDGASWRGYREIVRDPLREVPPPPGGDHGVSYPFVAVHPNGSAYYSLWVQTGEGRGLQSLDPSWLDSTSASDDFSNGLSAWSAFGTRGVKLAEDPQQRGRQVLSLSREDSQWPTAAVWNFPMGASGQLKMELMVEAGAPPLSVQLTDHFSPPSDEQSQLHSVLYVEVVTSVESSDQIVLTPNRWIAFEFDWDCKRGAATLAIEGEGSRQLRQQRVSPGPSYLRLVFPSGEVSESRVFVRNVEVEVSNHN